MLDLPTVFYSLNLSNCTTWNPNGITVAGNANGSAGSDLTSLDFPTCLFIDENGSLFISDQRNERIMKYSKNDSVGIIVAQSFTNGSFQYLLNNPRGIVVDLYGFVIVTTAISAYRILNYSNHSYATSVVQSNATYLIGELRDLHVDTENNLYACDSSNNHLIKITPNGYVEFIVSTGSNMFGSFVDLNQHWYIADLGTNILSMWYNGTKISSSSNGALQNPVAVVVNRNGFVSIHSNVALNMIYQIKYSFD